MSATAAKLSTMIQEFQMEDEKFEGGNAAAGTRARKCLMEIKRLCDTRRKEIQEKKNAA